jgi:hypothetical protein
MQDMNNTPDPQYVWLRLLETEVNIVANVLARLSPSTRANLRAANRASRQLVNSCVRGVSIVRCAPPPTDVADIFPNADILKIEESWEWGLGGLRCNVPPLASLSSQFLGKLRSLQLSIGAEYMYPHPTVLHRYSALQLHALA